MTLPNHKARRPFDDDKPDGYVESDRDYLLNNADLALELLNLHQQGRLIIKRPPKPPACACCGTTENLHRDTGSGGPWRCNSADCIVF